MNKPIAYRFDSAAPETTTDKLSVLAFGLHESPLSPWHRGSIDYRSRHFTSVAQLIAYSRARHFHAELLAEQVLAVHDPKQIRQLSQRISLDDRTWNLQIEKVMVAGMRELIAQNKESLIALLLSGDARLAFAVEADRVWGTGLPQGDSRLRSPDAWPGRNALGNILMDLRDGYFRPLKGIFIDPSKDPGYRMWDATAQRDIERLVEACFSVAEDIYEREFNRPVVSFDLRGRAAGRALVGIQPPQLKFNTVLMSENWQDFCDEAIPHEVAHLLTAELYGTKVRHHGPEWKSVMANLGCQPTRVHHFDTTNASRIRGKRVALRCVCTTHLLDGRRDFADSRCRVCGKEVTLMFSEEELIAQAELTGRIA